MPYATALSLHRQIPRVLRRNNLQTAELGAIILNALGAKKSKSKTTPNRDAYTARDLLRWTPADIDEYLGLGERDKLDFDPRALRQIFDARRAGRLRDAAWMRLEPYWDALLNTIGEE